MPTISEPSPQTRVAVVEQRDRSGMTNTELVEAARPAQVVLDGEGV
jgi:hypothetical protein